MATWEARVLREGTTPSIQLWIDAPTKDGAIPTATEQGFTVTGARHDWPSRPWRSLRLIIGCGMALIGGAAYLLLHYIEATLNLPRRPAASGVVSRWSRAGVAQE